MCPRQARRKRRDACDPGVDVGQLVDVAVREVVQENVADPRPIRHEGQRLSIGGPHRIDVLARVHVIQQLDLAGVDVIQRDPHVAEPQGGEVGSRPAVGGEGDGLPVRRPGGVEVRIAVIGETPQVTPVAIDDEEVGPSAIVACEHELLPVGGPGGARRAVQGQRDAPHLAIPLDVEDHQIVTVLVLDGDGELPPVRGERAGGVDEPQALEAGVHRRLDKPALDASGLRVRQVEVHEERVAFGQEGDVLAVG